MTIFIFLLSSNFYLLSPLGAVSVSKVQVAPRRGVVIATIDLERVFQAYPGTKKAKEELEKLILIKENEIAAKRSEIFHLTEEMARLKSQGPPPSGDPASGPKAPSEPATQTQLSTETLSASATAQEQWPGFSPTASSAPAVAQPSAQQAALVQKEADLKIKKDELRRMEREAEKNLESLEEAKTKTLLAKIYFAVRELAEEKHVDVVVDKNAILWGASRFDLTDELLHKLKSAMIERE